MTITDQYLANNREYAKTFNGPLPLPPAKNIAVVACMDARINVYGVLGLQEGESHVIRNAGGVVTDDEIRSLAISQRLLGTKEIILIHHTDCGLHNVEEDDFKHEIEDECGIRPWWALESFRDPFKSVTQNMKRLAMSPFIKHKMHIRGFVYDVEDGLLHEAPSA